MDPEVQALAPAVGDDVEVAAAPRQRVRARRQVGLGVDAVEAELARRPRLAHGHHLADVFGEVAPLVRPVPVDPADRAVDVVRVGVAAWVRRELVAHHEHRRPGDKSSRVK